MCERLFVLAEPTGRRLLNTEGVDVPICEFLMVEAGGRRFVCLFFCRLDAELLRIAENGRGNRYVLRESSTPELAFFIRELKDLHCALILGFAGTKDGRLYLNPTGQWSTCPMPLLPEDEAWLFRGGPKPERDIVKEVKRMYAWAGLGSYPSEVEEMNKLGEQELRVTAEEALRCADVAASGIGSRLIAYSLAGKAWRVGRRLP